MPKGAKHRSCKIYYKSLDENALRDIMALSSGNVNVATSHRHIIISEGQKVIKNIMS
jgi:hypothetical protein